MAALALLTTLHPGILDFAQAFGRSVAEQSDRAFDLWVALDGVTPQHAETAIDAAVPAQWLPARLGDSPARVREGALTLLTERYQGVVLADADDVLLPDRVETARRALEQHDVSVCAMRLVDAGGEELGSTFRPIPEAIGPERLARRNVVGLSNSAYRSALLKRCLPIPDQCRLVDWMLATRARAFEARFHVDPEPRMLYRQHDSNMARVLPPLDATNLDNGIALVDAHYRMLLSAPGPGLPEPSRAAVAEAAQRLDGFRRALTGDAGLRDAYLSAVNGQTPPWAWWEWVADPRLESLWKSR